MLLFGKSITAASRSSIRKTGIEDHYHAVSGIMIRHTEHHFFLTTKHIYQLSQDGGATWETIPEDQFNELYESIHPIHLF